MREATIRMKATHFNVYPKVESKPNIVIQFYDKKKKHNVLVEIEDTKKLVEFINKAERRNLNESGY